MATRSFDDAYTIIAIVVDADAIRYDGSEFKRVEGTPPAPWSKVLETAKIIKDAEKKSLPDLSLSDLYGIWSNDKEGDNGN